jgi:hypothetical protein
MRPSHPPVVLIKKNRVLFPAGILPNAIEHAARELALRSLVANLFDAALRQYAAAQNRVELSH